MLRFDLLVVVVFFGYLYTKRPKDNIKSKLTNNHYTLNSLVMDFSKDFGNQFQSSIVYHETDIDLNKKLQDTRHALQESTSENDQLIALIEQLYSEARVENVATTEMMSQIPSPLFTNMPLPRNADSISVSERAGYALYYLKFLGYAARRATEDYHMTKDHLEGLHKSIKDKTTEITIKRTGALKIPELDGQKEMKRSTPTKPLQTPPVTPPKQEKPKPVSRK